MGKEFKEEQHMSTYNWIALLYSQKPTIAVIWIHVPKGNQSWIFIGRTDAEAETPILQPPDVKNWLIGKDPSAGKHWRQEEMGMTEDEMVGWHHWLDGHEFKQALGVGDGQGSLACCGPWGHKESDMTELPNWLIPKTSTILSINNTPTKKNKKKFFNPFILNGRENKSQKINAPVSLKYCIENIEICMENREKSSHGQAHV